MRQLSKTEYAEVYAQVIGGMSWYEAIIKVLKLSEHSQNFCFRSNDLGTLTVIFIDL